MNKNFNPNFYRVRYKLPPLNLKSHDKELLKDAIYFVLLAGMFTALNPAMSTLGLIPFLIVLLFCRRWIHVISHSE
jgi:hypothetical protein